MGISISKYDVIWSYIAKFFALATSIIVLPFVLRMLTAEEVGMNYLMATISSMVMLIDFGFGPQFGRNFSYVYSGVQSLQKQGVEQNESEQINYHLLAVLLKTAKQVYQRLSIVGLMLMLTLGTAYIYRITDGFSSIQHSLLIWIIYSCSIYFNFYYSYYTTLLTGCGMVADSNKATILSRVVYIFLVVLFLKTGFGLLGVVIANFIAPFVQRFYCYKVYFTDELKEKIDGVITKEEIAESFQSIWYNAKKLGIIMLGSYGINKMGFFLVGLYLPLSDAGSYGLLVQLGVVLSGVAAVMNNSYLPKFSNYRVTGQTTELIKLFSFTVLIFWFVMLLGSSVVVFGAAPLLDLIGSNTQVPTRWICALYLLIVSLEGNHSMFAGLITTKNEVPFVKAALLSGAAIVLFTFIGLHFFSYTLLGVVLTQGLVQLAYNNWYWPRWVLRDLNVSVCKFISNGLLYMKERLQTKMT